MKNLNKTNIKNILIIAAFGLAFGIMAGLAI